MHSFFLVCRIMYKHIQSFILTHSIHINMRFFSILFLMFTLLIQTYAQTVEVQGQLKVTTVNQNNAANDVLVKNADGTVTKRDAATIEKQGSAVGDIKYWNGSAWTLLPIGPTGAALVVSPTNVPQWKKLGKSHLILKGNITDSEAAIEIANSVGVNTQFVSIQNTSVLTTVDLSGLDNLRELFVNNNIKLANLNLSGITTVNDMQFTNNGSLTTLTLPNLVKNTENFYAFYNPILTSLNLPSLTTNKAFTYISDNPNLATVSYPALTKNDSTFYIQQNKSTLNIAFPLFATNNRLIEIRSNGTTLSWPNFQINNGTFNCAQNNALTAINFGNFTTNNGSITISDHTNLTSIAMPLFNSNKNFSCLNNSALNALNLSTLATSTGDFTVTNNDALISLSLPAYTTSGTFSCTDNAILTTISIPLLSTCTAAKFYAFKNALPSPMINTLLAKFVAIGGSFPSDIKLNTQAPLAPPTGQGLIDKATLISMGKTVLTD